MNSMFTQTGEFRPIEIAGTDYIRLTDLTTAIGYGKGAKAAAKVMKYATVTALTAYDGAIHATVTISGAVAYNGEVWISEGLATMLLVNANTKEARNLKQRLYPSGNGDATDATNASHTTTDGEPTTQGRDISIPTPTKPRKSYLSTIGGTDYISKSGVLHVLGVVPDTLETMVENKRLQAGVKLNNRWYWPTQAIRDLINAGLSNTRTRKVYLPKLERLDALT